MLWGLRPVEQQAAYGLAVKRITRQIRLYLLLAGERLPPERRLAEEIGISRVTLREALRVLEGNGYLTIKRGAQGGAFIAEEATLRQLAARRVARDPGAVMRALEYRDGTVLMAVALAAQRRGVPDLKRMREAVERIGSAETSGHICQGETLFHLAVAEASQNPLIIGALEDALAEMFLPPAKTDIDRTRSVTADAYRAVLEAVDGRHDAIAQDAFRTILERDWSRVKAFPVDA
ncbi:MAG: GntR family transcriptional regulator [Pseudomonadota bacterium]